MIKSWFISSHIACMSEITCNLENNHSFLRIYACRYTDNNCIFFLFMTLESAYNCCKPQLYELLVVDHIQSSLEYVESLKFTLNFSFCCVEINSLSIHALWSVEKASCHAHLSEEIISTVGQSSQSSSTTHRNSQ